MLYTEVDPESFIQESVQRPAYGRGAWVREGIDFGYRYSLSPTPLGRIGTTAEKSLSYWAVAAGSHAIQRRLADLGYLAPLAQSEVGIWGPRTDKATRAFQADSADPATGRALVVDGICGTSDSRALFTPLIDKAEQAAKIPNRLLRGEVAHESSLDPGAVGYFIFYPDYRGVDRGICQINSKSNPGISWEQAYDPAFAFQWSASRLRSYFNRFAGLYGDKPTPVLWDAAVMAHNNPVAAQKWASTGTPPDEASAKYVSSVHLSIY